ncbi:MAG: AsmA family protein [Alphaproteobacteria bacterium]|nr:AsmA family protein [Alphaproteobacteria bacterium]
MTASTGLKRLGIAIAAVVLASFTALGAMALLIPVDMVRDSTKAEIRNVTGLDLVLRGDVVVSLFPTGSVSFSDVALGDRAKPVLAADRLTARLRFLPLFAGRIEIADVSLVRPHINVTFDRDSHSNWAGLIDGLARAVGPKANRPVNATSFTEIRITEGTISLDDAARGIKENFRNVELALAWPSISKSFAATGHVVWHDEPIESSVTLTDFAAALAGDRSGLKVRLSGAPVKFAFEGNWSAKPTLKIEGTLAADTPSLRDTLRWVGVRPPSGGGLGRFALKAKTSVSGGTIALSTVNVELDGNVAEGVLAFASDGRQTLQGTLAAEELDLTPYVSTVRLLTNNDRDWNRVPLAVDGLNSIDLDLRLSAARITLARAKLGRTAIAANLRGGKLLLTIGESQAFGGVLKGSMALSPSDAGAEFNAQLQFTDVDLEKCLGEIFQVRRLDGRGDIAVALDSSGNSVLGMTRGLNGTANLTGRQGSLVGWNVEQLLRRLERRPLSGTANFRNGRTPYEKFAADFKIVDGIATVEHVSLEGSKVRLGLAGSASIPARDFDLHGVAALASTSADAPPAFELPFVVQGPWDDPILLPDTQSLLARSPVASPLLNAVRNRYTRDTVRSAIERLTGGAVSPPAGAMTAAPKP